MKTAQDEPRKNGPVKVLLVDDSVIALFLMKKILSASPEVDVVGTARNGKEALELIPALDPEVICADLHMPVMDGLEFTREVMDRFPRPILIISVSVQRGKDDSKIFSLLEAGAVDVFPKPRGGTEEEYRAQSKDLISAIKILAGVHVFRRAKKAPSGAQEVAVRPAAAAHNHPGVVVIGASTGGPLALKTILSGLPAGFPAPVVCLQHIGEGFMEGLVEWLRTTSALKVEMAREGGVPAPGTVYFPFEGRQLLVDGGGRFRYSGQHASRFSSISETFRSIAGFYGGSAIGVLLTGMGDDGAEGMRAIKEAGGRTIAQDEKTSVVFSMPRHAIELGAADKVLPVDDIAGELVSRASSGR